MKTLIVGEGAHERSDARDRADTHECSDEPDRLGALASLVTRLSSHEMTITQDRVSRNDIHAHHGKALAGGGVSARG